MTALEISPELSPQPPQPNKRLSALGVAVVAQFMRVPRPYSFTEEATYWEATQQAQAELEGMGGVTHKAIHDALHTALTLADKVARAEKQVLEVIQTHGIDLGSRTLLGYASTVTLEGTELVVTQLLDGHHEFINAADGNAVKLHESLIPLIKEYGFYGAHEQRWGPRAIAETLGLIESPIPADDPIRRMLRERPSAQTRAVTTRDQVRRYENAVAVGLLNFSRLTITPLSHEAEVDLRRTHGYRDRFYVRGYSPPPATSSPVGRSNGYAP